MKRRALDLVHSGFPVQLFSSVREVFCPSDLVGIPRAPRHDERN